ncbi:MAG: replication-relaxation family protein [Planctomycetes bacterium]|nr:replication-relaxation family protein [Planctomycetota bacterium]
MTTHATPHVSFQDRDADILRLLHQLGAATPPHIHTASRAWADPFTDLHTIRRRLRKLQGAGWIRSYPLATHLPDARHYYRITRRGFRMLHPDAPMPEETLFRAIADSRQRHTFALAEILTHTVATAAMHRIRIHQFRREDEVTLEAHGLAVSPDHFLLLETGGRMFNLFLEVDRGTEPVEAVGLNSVRAKLAAYEAYQDLALAQWRFRFRVAFLTTSINRVHTILGSALKLAKNPDRLVCYAATFDAYLAEDDPLRSPLFLDHHGRFQSLVNLHPTSPFPRAPVRLRPSLDADLPV